RLLEYESLYLTLPVNQRISASHDEHFCERGNLQRPACLLDPLAHAAQTETFAVRTALFHGIRHLEAEYAPSARRLEANLRFSAGSMPHGVGERLLERPVDRDGLGRNNRRRQR